MIRILSRSKGIASLFTKCRNLSASAEPTSYRIVAAEREEQHLLRVSWQDRNTCDFPHIFLRDNCQCPECFHPTSKQRLFVAQSVDIDIQPQTITHDTHTNEVKITWPDNHCSVYTGKWLQERTFPKPHEKIKPTTLYGLETALWPDNIKETLPTVQFDALMSDDKVLLTYIENLYVLGLCIVKNSPLKPEICDEMAKRMSQGYVKQTHYGNIFTVKNKKSPNNLAYTSEGILLHVDLPYYSYQPEIQILHCIEQSQGENSGSSHLVDGFKAVAELKKRSPEYFDLLTKIKFKFNDIGTDMYGKFQAEYEQPIISLDKFGNVDGISHNNHVRSSFINATSEDVFTSYKAYLVLQNILYQENMLLEYKMEPGDILSFNNKRVLHGRTSFDARTTSRWLTGCYFDWDGVLSKYRVVRSELESSKGHLEAGNS